MRTNVTGAFLANGWRDRHLRTVERRVIAPLAIGKPHQALAVESVERPLRGRPTVCDSVANRVKAGGVEVSQPCGLHRSGSPGEHEQNG